jgi:hypothetical protein
MKKIIYISIILSSAVVISIVSCGQSDETMESSDPETKNAKMIARGEYLVLTVGCDDCHSPKRLTANGPEIIPQLRLSGYPSDRPIQKANTKTVGDGWLLFSSDLTSAIGPWGMSFAANITSDETGIGNWPEENFIRALREGKLKGHQSGRTLLPPMPWFVYKHMTDDDLKSIFAYLKTTRPVRNIVPGPKALTELN